MDITNRNGKQKVVLVTGNNNPEGIGAALLNNSFLKNRPRVLSVNFYLAKVSP